MKKALLPLFFLLGVACSSPVVTSHKTLDSKLQKPSLEQESKVSSTKYVRITPYSSGYVTLNFMTNLDVIEILSVWGKEKNPNDPIGYIEKNGFCLDSLASDGYKFYDGKRLPEEIETKYNLAKRCF